jgi:hypothetical protein
MKNKKEDRFEITELFVAKASMDRCFTGIIKRETDENGNPFVFSRIVMPDGLICASAPEQEELGKNLDEMAIMILDKNLHNDAGVSNEIFGGRYFLN